MSDAELVARLKGRDEEAYRELVERYSAPLHRYLYGITGDEQLGQDLLGETFLRVVEQIGRYEERGAPLRAWLYRIAHNLAIGALTRDRRVVPVADLERVARPVTDPAMRIADELEQAALRAELRAALPALTEEQQQVIALRFMSGQSLAETATAMGKNENAIKQLQFRALRALERQLTRRASYG